jgi:hypothetical protein
MRLFIGFEVFETITGAAAVEAARKALAEQVRQALGSGRVVESGAWADARGGFFLAEAESAGDVLHLLAPAILDTCRVTTRPVVGFEALKPRIGT